MDPPPLTIFRPLENIFCYAIFISFQHLSQSHIMPRTLPDEVIIFAGPIGLPQHWGT
jgi:hypothetical protein